MRVVLHIRRGGLHEKDGCCCSSSPEESIISSFVDGVMEEECPGELGWRHHDPEGETDPPAGAEN